MFDITVKDYLKEIDASPLLTAEQECELARRIIDYNDPQAREKMVRSNLRLVVNIAKKFARRGLSISDLIEEGNLGLIKAVDCFDPEHGVRFSTYAAWWIKQSIKRALLSNSQTVHIPTYMVEIMNQWRKTSSVLQAELGRNPTVSEMADVMQLPHRKAKIISQIIKTASFGFHEKSSDEDRSLDESLKDDKIQAPETDMLSREETQKVMRLLGEIEPREAQVLSLRFGLNGEKSLTLKQIGEKIGLTRERVRQIQRNALNKLHEAMTEDTGQLAGTDK